MNVADDRKCILPLVTQNDTSIKGSVTFNDIIGQVEAKKKMIFYVDSHSQYTPFPTVLLCGSPGLGKNHFSQKIAEALGREFVYVNCSSILTTKDLIEGILIEKVAGDIPKTILMDESHELSTEVTTNLLTLLSPNVTNKNVIGYKNWLIEYDFSRINMIFATTDAHRMFRPLVNRCEEIYLSIYSNNDLFDILCFYLPNIKIICDKNDIAYACRGRARDAFLLSQKISRYCIKEGTTVFNDDDWNKIKDIFSIHPYGLKTEEVTLLRMIDEHKTISSANLAVMMGVNVSNIESEIEIRPRELGFIESGTRGRSLTDKGKKYISSLK